MKSLLVFVVTVFMVLGFSVSGFTMEQKAATGSHQTVVIPEKKIAQKESAKMETATGKVTAIDPQGKAIVIAENIGGKETMDVGTIVDKDTIVKVKGKEAKLQDLKVGDTVTVRYLKSNDLYAKEVSER
jgi:hypothetical protein